MKKGRHQRKTPTDKTTAPSNRRWSASGACGSRAPPQNKYSGAGGLRARALALVALVLAS